MVRRAIGGTRLEHARCAREGAWILELAIALGKGIQGAQLALVEQGVRYRGARGGDVPRYRTGGMTGEGVRVEGGALGCARAPSVVSCVHPASFPWQVKRTPSTRLGERLVARFIWRDDKIGAAPP